MRPHDAWQRSAQRCNVLPVARDANGLPLNAFTVDLEEWYCSQNLRAAVPRYGWMLMPRRAERATCRLLELLDRRSITATVFVLGWVAETQPRLVRAIADAGHEIASHGYGHELLTELTPGRMRDDLRRAIAVTQDCCGAEIVGYRAPAFTVTRSTLWAYDIMAELGIRYSSSVFPIGFHPEYGMRDAPLLPYRAGAIIELPLSVASICGVRFPCSGGGYFRWCSYRLFRALANRCHRQGRPLIFYIHPSDLDPNIPRLRVPPVQRLRFYGNIEPTFSKLEQMLLDYSFTTLGRLMARATIEERSSHVGFLLRGAPGT